MICCSGCRAEFLGRNSMSDTGKSKAQLILEMEELRNQVSDLELTISNLSNTENELANRTVMLDNILRTATDVAIATTDINLVITYYNPIAEKIFGYTAEEVIGKTVMEIHLKENVAPDRLERAVQIVHKTGEYKYSLEQETENGIRYLNSRVSSILDANGEMVGFCLFSRDVTKSRIADENLQESKENYSNLVESISDWVWAIDLYGSHTFTNKAIKPLLGYEVAEILGGSAFPMMHPDDANDSKLMVEGCIKEKKGWTNIAIRWLHKDGSVHLFNSSSRPIFDSNEEVTGFTGIDRDITEQKKAEEALLKSEFDMRTLFNAMTDIVFEMDYDGRYVNIAPTSPDLMFKPAESSIGKTLHEVFPKDEADQFLGFIQACINKNETLTIEYPLFMEDKTVWFEGRATPKTENTVLYIATDITRRKQLEEQAKHRLIALTQPKVDLGDDLVLTDILDLNLLQSMQDSFADAFSMPSVIYGVDGSYITKPSRFTPFCELLHTTEEGLRRCEEFDKKLMLSLQENQSPQIRTGCALSNIVTGTVPIIIQDMHLANWGIGQMVNSELDIDEIRKYALEIGLDTEELVNAAKELVPVENKTFEMAVMFLSTLSSQLSVLALQNLQQARDIEARDKAEKALLNERRLFVSGPTVVFRWVASDGWPVEYVSPNVKSVFGVTAEEFMSGQVSFTSVVYPDDISRVADEKNTLNHIDSFEQEYRIIQPDGTVRWIFDITVITRDEDGSATHYEGYVLDVTNRKDAEVERERLMMAIEQAAEAVVITDVHGSIEYVNPSFERITGYLRDEVIGMNPRVLKSGEHNTTFYANMWQVLSEGHSWNGKFVNRKKDGSVYTEEASITPIKNSIGEIINYVAVKRDITVEVKLEDQLRQATKMEAVGQLAGGVAHDFNNLLQVINGYTELALADMSPEHSTYEYIQEIEKAGSRAQALVSQLLSFSRRQIIKPVDINLNDVTEKLMTMIKRVIGEHIQCKFIPGHELGTIHADSGQMEQILMNLCVNSRDAMPGGGNLTIETCNALIDSDYALTHPWSKPGRYVLLSVTDDGSGMDKNTQKSIFDPFFTTKKTGKGTGLGMSTVYGIVKQHKGDIQVYSEPGKGTMFKIYLPVVERKATEIPSKVEAAPKGGKETILLAEDDEMVRNLTRQALIMAGYTVIEAANGGEALTLFNKHATQVNLLLLDVVMPGLGGKEVYDRIIETHPSIPTLFCSGYSHNAIHTGFVLDQGLNFIQKPYSPDTLLRTIRKILD